MRSKMIWAAVASLLAAGLVSGVSMQSASAETDGGGIVPVTNWRLFTTTSTTPMYSGQTQTLQVTGTGGIPSTGVSAVVVEVAASSAKSVYVTVAPSGSGQTYSQLSVQANDGWDSNTAIVRVSSTGKVDLSVSGGATQIKLSIQGYVTSDATTDNGGFVAITQARIARSDTGQGFASTAALVGGWNYVVDVAGVGGVPEDASAVFANVRVFYATGSGGLRTGPSTLTTTSESALLYQASGAYDSAALVRLGSDGKIRLFANAGTNVHVMIDVQGYVTPGDDGAGFTPIVPKSILTADTSTTHILGGETRDVQVTGVAGIPEVDDVGAAMFDFIATTWTSTGSLTLYNADDPQPNVWQLRVEGSSTNTPQRTTVIARVSADGKVKITNHGTAPVGVRVAVQGWFSRDIYGPPTDLSTDVSGESVSMSARAMGDSASSVRVRFVVYDSDGNEVSNGFSDEVPAGSIATRELPSLANGEYSVKAWGVQGEVQSQAAAETDFDVDYADQDPPEDSTSTPVEPDDPEPGDPPVEGMGDIEPTVQSEATAEEEAAAEAAIDAGTEEFPAEVVESMPGAPMAEAKEEGVVYPSSYELKYSPNDCKAKANDPHISTSSDTYGWTKGYAFTQCEDEAAELYLLVRIDRKRWWGWQKKGYQRGSMEKYNTKKIGASGAWNGCNNNLRKWRTVSSHYEWAYPRMYEDHKVNYKNKVNACK